MNKLFVFAAALTITALCRAQSNAGVFISPTNLNNYVREFDSSGNMVLNHSLGTAANIEDLAFSSSGDLYVLLGGSTGTGIDKYDPATGNLTQIVNTSVVSGGRLAISASGNFFVSPTNGNNFVQEFDSSGNMVLNHSLGTAANIEDLAFSGSGDLYVLLGGSTGTGIDKFDPATRNLTLIASTSVVDGASMAIPTGPVSTPEPSSLLLWGLGAAFALCNARRSQCMNAKINS